MPTATLRYSSVCDGIGAAHVAWQPLGWQCQWTSEIEPFPVAVVEHHYGFRNLGNMTKITEDMIHEPVDLLVGGTPCQSFSVAGLRGGLADPRGNLALRFVQLAAVMQPRWIVWENVPGVLSSGKGRDFGTFLGALGELGYGFAYRILDAQWFGVAQRRRRVFVVGYLGDWRRAAAVLFERESVFGNPPTRGKAWEGVARSTAASLTSSGRGVERPGESRGQDDVVLSRMRGFGDYAADGTASALKRRDYKDATDLIAEPQALYCNESRCDNIPPAGLSPPLKIGSGSGGNPPAVALPYTKSKRGHSVTDDESWVPGEVSPTMSCFDQGDMRATTVVAVDLQNVTAGGDLAGTLDTTRPSRGGGQAVAYDILGTPATNGAKRTDVHTALRGRTPGQSEASTTTVVAFDTYNQTLNQTLRAGASEQAHEQVGAVFNGMAVRRLTPRECERLQGFPDDYTLVTYRGKPACDGPRYQALGNSMAVPVMRWIGERISILETVL
jgi:DNA (cytosine-5)-methyltransferase 1